MKSPHSISSSCLKHFCFWIFVLVTATQVHGGVQTSEGKTEVASTTRFDQGRLELQSTSGAYFSISHPSQPSLNYSYSAYRLGIMLNTPHGSGCFRGNLELMLQLSGGSVMDGPGNYLLGAAGVLRYNFVQPNSRWAPYIQIAAGTLYNDIYKDYNQRLIGQPWEIELEAAIGVRFFFNDAWSANLEGGYHHLSNANMSSRNIGLNSLGASIGLSRHF